METLTRQLGLQLEARRWGKWVLTRWIQKVCAMKFTTDIGLSNNTECFLKQGPCLIHPWYIPLECLAQYWVHSRCSTDINNSVLDASFKDTGLLSISWDHTHRLVCYHISALWPWDQLALPQGELYWVAFHLLIKYLLSPCLGPEQTPQCNHGLLYQSDLGANHYFPLTTSMHLRNLTLVISSEKEGWKSYQFHKMLVGMKGEWVWDWHSNAEMHSIWHQ